MKDLTNYMYEHMDQLGHELTIGDFIRFKPRGMKADLYGQIQELTPDDKKYRVRIMGWYGDKITRNDIKKDFYEIDVTSKSIYQLDISDKKKLDELRKQGILI